MQGVGRLSVDPLHCVIRCAEVYRIATDPQVFQGVAIGLFWKQSNTFARDLDMAQYGQAVGYVRVSRADRNDARQLERMGAVVLWNEER